MQATLLTAGIALVIAAIVGGKLKAFGLEIPGINKASRQILLGIFGLAILGAAFIVIPDDHTQKPTPPLSPPDKNDLIGSWVGSRDCVVNIIKDDGKIIEGDCDAVGYRHHIQGIYESNTLIRLQITRTDPMGCLTAVNGYIKILNENLLEIGQEGWRGCGLSPTTQPPQQLRR